MRTLPDLFRGRDDVHGAYGILNSKPTDRGKRTGKAATRRLPVTPELWQAHLEGRERLGIVPVLKDGTCWWFCIDVDHYQETGLHEEIAAKIEELSLPLVMTRSKSGGAHLWCFLSEPMQAARARIVAAAMMKKLDLPAGHVDIFPAQASADDVGNWMNMPYFGDQCHATGVDGTGNLTLEQFEAYANASTVHPSDLDIAAKKNAKKASSAPKSDLPPCIDHMIAEGVPEGGRNNTVTHVGVVFKRKYPDSWEEELQTFNSEHCEPPLDRAEMRSILASVRNKEFGYFCDKIRANGIPCDKPVCKKRDFGVGGQSDGGVPIDSIEKIDGEEPIYRITMFDKTFQIDLETLFNYQLFRRSVLGACNHFLPNMKNDDWAEICQEHLDLMAITDAAPDTQMGERVLQNFKRFAAGATSEGLEVALTRGLPFYDETNKHIVFRGDDFMQLIDRNLKIDRDRTWVYLREDGCIQNTYTVTGKKEKLWCFVVAGDLWFDPAEGERA